MAQTGKIAEVLFEKTMETYEHQMQMLDLVDIFQPDQADMQNAGDAIWRPTQQHAPIIEGWDLTGQETDIIEETYPAILGLPKNDLVQQRADDLRDKGFWERRGVQSGRKQATQLNSDLAALVANTGSIFYRSNATDGFDFISEAQAILNERQALSYDVRHFVLNDRTNKAYSADLAARQTLQGRPERTWVTGQIGQNIAEFDVHVGSYLKNLAGGADPATTTTAAVSDKPEGGTVNQANNTVTNVDYRLSSPIPVLDSSGYNVGDRVKFVNAGTDVKSIGLADKNITDEAMTFVIVAKDVVGTDIQVFPKPIALDDGALTTLEKAYANIDTVITSGAAVERLNIDASAKTNIFWCKDSLEVTSGDAPIQLLNEFGGMKVVSSQMKNGQTLYMAYDGDIDKLTFKYRLFTWYNVTNKNPSANGVAIRY